MHRDDNGIPLLPDDLGDLNDAALMDLFNRMTTWCNYMAMQLTLFEVREDDAEAILKVVESKYVVANTTAGERGLQRALRERDLDDEVIKSRDKVRALHTRVKMTRTLFENTERSIALVSRELSRRIGLAPMQGRQAKYNP